MTFRSIAIVGLGLIGGSFAAAAKRLDDPPRLLGVNRGAAAVERALADGLIDEGASPDEAIEKGWLSAGGADLVVLGTPALVTEEWLVRLGELGYDGVVTDVASTKAAVVRAARKSLRPPARFVGGHPMAGSERSGVDAAREDLFDGAFWILTPTADTDMEAYRKMHALVSALGARVVSIDPTTHDDAVAIVSHVPHIAAAALCDVAGAHAGKSGELLRLAAGGFKDTTRIAAGSPDLWTGICLDNASALARGLRELRGVIGEFEAMVRSGDAEAIREWLDRAADVRRSLPTQWVPASTQLTELIVPVIDRPGVVSEVTTAVSSAGCNIEDIEIDHQSEDTALLRLVLTDEGNLPSLLAELASLGYSPRVTPLEESAGDAS